MGRRDNSFKAACQILIRFDKHNLRTRNHNVAHAQFGDFHHAFNHLASILIDKFVLFRIADDFHQFFTVFQLALKKAAK